MGVLYYWRPDNYQRDRAFGFWYHLNQNSPRLAELRPGQHVWAFTRRRSDGFYVLAADLPPRTHASQMDPYWAHILQRWDQGYRTAQTIH